MLFSKVLNREVIKIFSLSSFASNHTFSKRKLNKLVIDAEDYLKDTRFDKDIKSEMLKKEQQVKNAEDPEKIKIKQSYEEEIKKTQGEFKEAESILRSFRNQLSVDETDNISKAENLELKEFVDICGVHFNGKSHEEIINRSKKMKEAFRLRQDWSPLTHLNPNISDQYGHYSHYQKTFPVLKDSKDGSWDLNENNREEFLKNIDSKLIEKIKILKTKNVLESGKKNSNAEKNKNKKIIRERKKMFPEMKDPPPISREFNNYTPKNNILEKFIITSESLNKILKTDNSKFSPEEKKEIEEILNNPEKFKEFKKNFEFKNTEFAHNKSFIQPMLDEYGEIREQISWRGGDLDPKRETDEYFEKSNVINGRISPWCREEIFKLFMQGWSVRDLSVRYGILPERVKAIVWCRKTFYDEIVPCLNLKTVRLGAEREMFYGMYFPWVDYGLDLEKMIEREKGVPTMNFARANAVVDVKAREDVERRMERILENKTKKKFDKVTEKVVGTGNKGYVVKSWIVYKGHGSERVNRGFKKAVHDSERRWRLSYNESKKVKLGPRYVGISHGIK